MSISSDILNMLVAERNKSILKKEQEINFYKEKNIIII